MATVSVMNVKITERTTWIIALMALPVNEIISLAGELSVNWLIRPKSVPQSGLGMLKLNDSAFNEPFFLGEIPIASAWLEVTTPEGHCAEGAAQVMDDRHEVAEALALCDAVLSSRLPGWEKVAAMVEKGVMVRNEVHQERKRMLAHTRVNFSLLDEIRDADVDT